MDFSSVRWLSFDCYGTLIDWESGILGAVRPILARHHAVPSDADILERYAALEADLESGDYRPYREVLRAVMSGLGDAFSARLSPAERDALPDSLHNWPAFPDTPAALAKLKSRFRLAVLSNIDDDLFAFSAPRLGVPLDALITAQQCRSYKPSLNNFHRLLDRTGAHPDQLIHVAQSLYHDHAPARSLGLRTVWINRPSARPNIGIAKPAHVMPDLELPDLASLAAIPAP